MKMTKTAIILVLAMSLAMVFNFPAVSADSVEDLMLADFTQDSTYENVQNTARARLAHSGMAGLSGKTSGRYILNGGGTGVSYNLSGVDFTKYNVLNFWAYNDGYGEVETDPSKQFVMVFRSNGSNAWSNNLAYKEIKIDWKGWKKFSISLDSLTTLGTVKWANVTDIQLRPEKLNAAAVTDYWDDIFFDRIWLSNSNPGYLIGDIKDKAAMNKYVINGTSTSGFAADESLPHYYSFSGNMTVDTGKVIVFYNDADNVIDMTKYTHLNFAMYSDKDTTGYPTRVRIYMYSTNGGWYQTSVDATWTGWRLISVPISSFTIGKTSTTVELKDCATVKGFRLFKEKDSMGAKLNFDRFAFTNGAPAAISPESFSMEDNAENIPLTNKKITLSYNNILSEYLNPSSVVIEKNGEVMTEGYSAGTKGKNIEIFFDRLDLDSNYTITVNNVVDINSDTQTEAKTISFKTASKAIELCGDIGFKDKSGAVITALNGTDSVYESFTIKNNTAYAKNIFAIVAVYDDEGRQLVKVACKTKTIDPGQELYVNDIGFDITPKSGYTAKAFVWDSVENLIPISSVTGSIGY